MGQSQQQLERQLALTSEFLPCTSPEFINSLNLPRSPKNPCEEARAWNIHACIWIRKQCLRNTLQRLNVFKLIYERQTHQTLKSKGLGKGLGRRAEDSGVFSV